MPAVTTPVQILRMEVWVTNKNGTTTNAQGNCWPNGSWRSHIHFTILLSRVLCQQIDTNTEYSYYYQHLKQPQPSSHYQSIAESLGLNPVQDFEKTFARKLDSTQYIYNPKVGFISLSQPLQADEVLGSCLSIFLQWKNLPGG